MGLVAVLEDEFGKSLQRVEDRDQVLNRILPTPDDARFSCLNVIDPYGDTVFNRLQAPRFLQEWREVSACAVGPAEAELMAAVASMAARVATEHHLYLKFYGD